MAHLRTDGSMNQTCPMCRQSLELPRPAPPRVDHKTLQELQVRRNHAERDKIKAEMRLKEIQLKKRVPGTIRALQRDIRDLKQRLKTNIQLSGALYNGGVW